VAHDALIVVGGLAGVIPCRACVNHLDESRKIDRVGQERHVWWQLNRIGISVD